MVTEAQLLFRLGQLVMIWLIPELQGDSSERRQTNSKLGKETWRLATAIIGISNSEFMFSLFSLLLMPSGWIKTAIAMGSNR